MEGIVDPEFILSSTGTKLYWRTWYRM